MCVDLWEALFFVVVRGRRKEGNSGVGKGG